MTFQEKIKEEINKLKLCIKEFSNKKINNKVKKKLSAKYTILGIAILGVIGVFLIFNIMNDTKKDAINKLVKGIESNNISKIQKILVNENGEEITINEATAFLNFYKNNSQRITVLEKNLESNSSTDIKFIKENKFLGSDYKIEVLNKKINITTNLDDVVVFVNNEELTTIKNKTGSINLPAFGEYDIKLEKKGDYSTISASKKIDLTSDVNINIPLNGIYITLKSNIENAKVYINDVNSNLTVAEFKNIGPFPTDGTYNLILKYNTPFGEISSESVPIKDLPEIEINLNLKNSGIKASLNTAIGKFYSSVFDAINTDNKDKIVNATDEAKNKIYEDIKKNSFILKNIYKLNSSSIDFEKSSVEFLNGSYQANVVANIDYNVKKELLGLAFKTQDYSEQFSAKLVYENGEWEIYDIQNFNLNTLD
ncbi:MAG: TcaA 3rd/4th domain-containing protein [Sarcina sp.]